VNEPECGLETTVIATGLSVSVRHRATYPVYIGQGLADALPAALAQACGAHGSPGLHLLTDATVAGHHLPAFDAAARDAGFGYTLHVLPEGEETKSVPALTGIWGRCTGSASAGAPWWWAWAAG
jgi:3-dehydroquinate synthetase